MSLLSNRSQHIPHEWIFLSSFTPSGSSCRAVIVHGCLKMRLFGSGYRVCEPILQHLFTCVALYQRKIISVQLRKIQYHTSGNTQEYSILCTWFFCFSICHSICSRMFCYRRISSSNRTDYTCSVQACHNHCRCGVSTWGCCCSPSCSCLEAISLCLRTLPLALACFSLPLVFATGSLPYRQHFCSHSRNQIDACARICPAGTQFLFCAAPLHLLPFVKYAERVDRMSFLERPLWNDYCSAIV